MNTDATTNNATKRPLSKSRRTVLWVAGTMIFGIAGTLFALTRPNAQESPLVGIWRLHFEGTNKYELIKLDERRRLNRFESTRREFFHEGFYWHVNNGRLIMDETSRTPGLVRALEDLWIASTSGIARPDPRAFEITWRDDDNCTLNGADEPVGSSVEIHLERIKDFDPSIWDERGMPIQASPSELR